MAHCTRHPRPGLRGQAASALLGLVLLAGAFPAAAGPVEDAEVFVKKGIALRKEGKDFQALAEFQHAYDIAQTPRTTGQLGLVEFALSRWMPAETHLEEALKASTDPWIAKNVVVLKQALKAIQSHIGQIELEGDPAGAQVFVNGKPRGTLPLKEPIRVGEGFAEVELKSDGYAAERRTVKVRGEFTEPLFMKLDRLAPATKPPGSTLAGGLPPPEGKKERAEPEHSGNSEAPDDSSRQSRLQVVGLTMAAVGVVALATGAVLTLKVRAAKSDIEQEARPGALMDPGDLHDRLDRGNRLETWQWVSYAAGGALVAAGATCWMLGRSKGTGEQRSIALLPLLDGDGAGASAILTF